MSVIPAQEAGVSEVIVTSPRPAPAVLVAADLLGVKKIYRLGGAQAVAAFAFGTESVPRVDKIVGPGNRYVAAAKKLVAGECGIDFIAGPSELVLVGGRGNAEWIAADLVAQAEHDPDAVAIFITPSLKLALQVQAAARGIVARLDLPLAGQSLSGQGGIIVTRNLAEAAGACQSPGSRTPYAFRGRHDSCWDACNPPARSFWVRTALLPREIMPRGRITFFPPAERRACAEA